MTKSEKFLLFMLIINVPFFIEAGSDVAKALNFFAMLICGIAFVLIEQKD